jgi:hypothetical protein
MTTLSKADKLTLLNSKIRSVNYSKYGLELDLIQENAKSSPNQEEISRLEDIVEDSDRQLAALNEELAEVQALTE